jgi:hypothetical protein
MIFRVEITRDETRDAGPVTAEITAYIEREPEHREVGHEKLQRAWAGVWNSRLLVAGDFAELADALAAIGAEFPAIDRIQCYEWASDYDYPIEVPPLVRRDGKWLPAEGEARG